MAAKKSNTIPARKTDLYNKLVATAPDIELKGASMPYTSLNGHMFSFLDKEGTLALRLPKGDREAFIETYNTSLCEAHGTILKEYVVVPDLLFENTKKMKVYFQKSVDYVSSLKPKATKRSSQ